LTELAFWGEVDALRDVIDAGAAVDQVDTFGETALFVATQKGHARVVDLLLQAGADPNQRDALTRTPLHVAARRGHAALIKRLIAAGGDPNQRDLIWGRRALHYAAAAGCVEVFEALSRVAGIDAQATDDDGRTPADLAAGPVAALLKTGP
jgi:cytohesin